MQWEALRQGLRDHGYVEGRNVILDFRSADGKQERLADLATEMVQRHVDVIIAAGTQPARAAQRATRSIPIVMSNVGDPVGAGLVTNLARPAGNITGLSLLATELSAKRLAVLKEALPEVTRVGVLWNPDNASVVLKVRETEAAAPRLALRLQSLAARQPGEIENLFQSAARSRAEAIITADDQFLSSQRSLVVALAMRHRLPIVSEFREFAEAGGLCSYGPSLTDQGRRAAAYVDKILKGAKPGDLPIEQPVKFELIINLKSAKALGLTIPPSLLLRADEVIE